jgi:hypothetical protein
VSVFWIVVVVAAVVFALLLFSLMALAKQEDRTSRHIQHSINPFDDITITKPGE